MFSPTLDECDLRPDPAREAFVDARLAAVMPRFQHVDALDARTVEHLAYLARLGVAGQKDARLGFAVALHVVANEQTQAVGVSALFLELVRPYRRTRELPDPDRIARTQSPRMPGARDIARRAHERAAIVAPARKGAVGEQHVARKVGRKRFKASAMIAVVMGHEHAVYRRHAVAGKGRQKPLLLVSRIDQERFPFASHEERIPLPHVEHDHLVFRRERSESEPCT